MDVDWTTVDDIGGMPTTRASAGYLVRAGALQTMIGDAHQFLAAALHTDFAPTVVVVDQTDWAIGGDEAPPYGIPYASDDSFEVVIPANPAGNFLVDTYAASGSRESAERFADLIAVHELGHLHSRQMGLTLPNGWLSEFLATYLACCYMTVHQPEDASLWFTLARARTNGPKPTHRSLETLDQLYFEVGPENYIWYQDTFSVMVEQVHSDVGLDFPLQLRSAELSPDSDTHTTLAAATKIHPGFQAWAASLRE